MSIHHRKLKKIQLDVDGHSFECQIQEWTFDPGEGEGERMYSMCDEQFIEDEDPEPTLELTMYSDWRSEGVSDFLFRNKGKTATFTLDHRPDTPEEHVRFSGQLKVRPPSVGGEARETEMTEITLPVIDYDYERVN